VNREDARAPAKRKEIPFPPGPCRAQNPGGFFVWEHLGTVPILSTRKMGLSPSRYVLGQRPSKEKIYHEGTKKHEGED